MHWRYTKHSFERPPFNFRVRINQSSGQVGRKLLIILERRWRVRHETDPFDRDIQASAVLLDGRMVSVCCVIRWAYGLNEHQVPCTLTSHVVWGVLPKLRPYVRPLSSPYLESTHA